MVPEPQSVKTPAEYVILRRNRASTPNTATPLDPNGWSMVKTVTARSQADAIKQAADSKSEGVYVAVPARSWAPTRVKPKTVTTLELEEAGS